MEHIYPLNTKPLNIIPRHVAVIPYAFKTDRKHATPYFLLGEEHDSYNYDKVSKKWRLWQGSRTWSFFGGRPENTDRNYLEAAAREAYEETMGVLGTQREILQSISYDRVLEHNEALFFPMEIEYDEKLPVYYYRIRQYLKPCLKPQVKEYLEDVIPSCPVGYLEKTDLRWATHKEIISAHENGTARFTDYFLHFVEDTLWNKSYFEE